MSLWVDDRYLDYLAEHESGFMESHPPRIIGMRDAIRELALETGATFKELTPMTNRRRRRAKAIRKAGGVRKAGKK